MEASELVQAYLRRNPKASIRKIAEETGLSRWTVGRLVSSGEQAPAVAKDGKGWRDEVDLPEFPSGTLDANTLLDHIVRAQSQKIDEMKSRDWFPIGIKKRGPIAVVFWGDPHIDSGSCDVALLRSHVEAVAQEQAVYSVCMGDVHDNWVGRLAREYAKSSVSAKEAKVLIRWFFSQIKLLLAIRGNHDMWTPSEGAVDAWLAKEVGAACEDWSARFRLVFPGGREAKIVASHSFPGRSEFHTLHGNLKAARNSAWEPDLHVSGHTHDSAMMEKNGKWLAKAAGYKQLGDTYAKTLGYGPCPSGHSIVAVFDPDATDQAEFLQCYSSVPRGLKVLALMREEYKARGGR